MVLPLNVLNTILEVNPFATVYADHTGLIQYWNRAAEKMFGYTAEQVLGQSLDLIIPEKLRVAHWRGFEQAMASGVARLGGQFVRTRAQTAAGQACYVEVSFALIADDDRAPIGAVAFCRPTD